MAKDMCRVCLARNELSSLFLEQGNTTISQKIMSLASVTISTDDPLPHSICSSCMERLHHCYTFKLDCENSDTILRSQLSQNKEYVIAGAVINKNDTNSNIVDTNIRKKPKWKRKKKSNKITTPINISHQTVKIKLVKEEPKNNFESIENITEDQNPELFEEEKYLFEVPILSEKSFSDDNVQEKHHPKQKSQKEQCFTCGRVMSSRFRLKMHLRTHTGEKPFTCVYCNKTFSLAQNLKVHERVHTGEKPLHCSMCGKSFAQSAGLVAHMRLHTGETPYRCTLCSSSFRTPGHLQYHIRKHTGEKKFECETCGRAFITRSDLKQHVQTHTGERPHVCSVCGLQLARASHLKRHMAVHDGPQPFVCRLCNSTFSQRVDMQKHKKTHTTSSLAQPAPSDQSDEHRDSI